MLKIAVNKCEKVVRICINKKLSSKEHIYDCVNERA